MLDGVKLEEEECAQINVVSLEALQPVNVKNGCKTELVLQKNIQKRRRKELFFFVL